MMIRFFSFFRLMAVTLLFFAANGMAYAQSANQNRLMLSAGLLYERGLDATLAWEHETRYHHAWEFFASAYTKFQKDEVAGHYTKDSFWKSYNTWNVGVAYKPCISRGRNHYGSLRIGASAGSDTHEFIGFIHVGYEHTYALRSGWALFFQLREDVSIPGKDNFRTGFGLGVKCPL